MLHARSGRGMPRPYNERRVGAGHVRTGGKLKHALPTVTEWLRGSEIGIKVFSPSLRFVHREREKERGTLADGALHARGSIERRHQVLDDGKTQTGAAQLSRAGLIHAA